MHQVGYLPRITALCTVNKTLNFAMPKNIDHIVSYRYDVDMVNEMSFLSRDITVVHICGQ